METISVILKVYSARNLAKRSLFRHPYPFICVKTSSSNLKSDFVPRTLNPEWNKTFELELQSISEFVDLSIWDNRLYTSKPTSSFLGHIYFNLSIIDDGVKTHRLQRDKSISEKGVRGAVKFELCRKESSSSIIDIPNLLRDNTNINSQTAVQNNTDERNISASHVLPKMNNSNKEMMEVQLPNGNEQRITQDGKLYYIDLNEGTMHWYHPGIPKNLRKITNYECLGPLPPGWDTLKSDNGRPYFINHNKRTTQYSDPRLLQALATPNGVEETISKLRQAGIKVKDHSGCSQNNSNSGSSGNNKNQRTRNGSASNSSNSNNNDKSTRKSNGSRQDSQQSQSKIQSNHLLRLSSPSQSQRTTNQIPFNRNRSQPLPNAASNFQSSSPSSSYPISQNFGHEPSSELVPVISVSSLTTPYSENVNPSENNGLCNAFSFCNIEEINETQEQDTSTNANNNNVDNTNGIFYLHDNNNKINSGVSEYAQNNLVTSVTSNYSNMSNTSSSISSADDIVCEVEVAPLSFQRQRISRPTSDYVQKNKQAIELKLKNLRAELKELAQRRLCVIETSRDDILDRSYKSVRQLKPQELRRRLVIKFTDEEGLDYGGVAREWLYLLSETLFSCRHGLFEASGGSSGQMKDGNLLRVSSLSSINDNHLRYFHFIGRIIGIAIFHSYYLDADFCRTFYRRMLKKKPCLDDFKYFDNGIYQSLKWILENNIDDAELELFFSVEEEIFGQLNTMDLIQNGRNIPVTEHTKKRYIDRYIEYQLHDKCKSQYEQIRHGIYDVLPDKCLENMNEDEIEVLLTGISQIDIDDWQRHTRLKHCTESNDLIIWFWKVVRSYTESQRIKLLQFVTGSSRIPLLGFEGLRGSYGSEEPKLFTIKVIKNANPISLPKAHTCFNRLDLPPYTSYENLYSKLTCAIEETCGFAVS